MAFDALILGGGFAGLSCAAALAQAGKKVLVVEKKGHLGGRAYSFIDPKTGHPVDNGQHLFMGCYRHTRKFLRTIGSEALLRFPNEVRVDFVDVEAERDVLRCPAFLASPWHLAWGVLGLRGLSLRDKAGLWRLGRGMARLRGAVPAEVERRTVREWMSGLGLSARLQERVFDPIALGALNEDPERASALGFVQVLREIFFRGVEGTKLGLSSVGLSELYTGASRSYLEARGGEVLLSRRISGLIEEGGRAAGAVSESGEKFSARAVVSTLPSWDLKALELPAVLRGPWQGLKPAPIIGISLWLDRPVLAEPFLGMIGTEVQWVFNKTKILGLGDQAGQYLSLVLSGAHRHLPWEPKALLALVRRDLGHCFHGFEKARIQSWKVIKEPFATLSPTPGSEQARPDALSPLPGFYFAGDWTRTNLPATIESAVASGHRAAEKILEEPPC
ncbi:MAG: FAD-dependent oxidoreductase [Elusimicrobia bacterium]|nr:FAD-dependent oxidoreductase [Elusimicrobiota bacterium]